LRNYDDITLALSGDLLNQKPTFSFHIKLLDPDGVCAFWQALATFDIFADSVKVVMDLMLGPG
jgi:hypothetical protein